MVGLPAALGQRCGVVRCPLFVMCLDGGVARGSAADFLLFDSSGRVLHDPTRFIMPGTRTKIVRVIKSMLKTRRVTP